MSRKRSRGFPNRKPIREYGRVKGELDVLAAFSFRLFSRDLLTLLILIIFSFQNVVFASASEGNFWKERQEKVEQFKRKQSSGKLAGLPKGGNGLKGFSWPIGGDIFMRGGVPSLQDSWSRAKDWPPTELRPVPTDPRLEAIPLRYGRIREMHRSPDKTFPLVVLVQDVHLHREAQKNIAKILEGLARHYIKNQPQRLWVGVEGSFKEFHFDRYLAFDKKSVGKRVSEFLFQNKEISAPSYAALTAGDSRFRLIGVDDRHHYEAHVDSVRSATLVKKKAEIYLEKTKARLGMEIERAFNPRLREFNAIRASFQSGALSLGRYIQVLDQMPPDLDKGLVLEQFLAALELENSLDFDRVDPQKADSYLRYILLADQIDGKELMGQLKRWEGRLEAGLTQNVQEEKLLGQSRQVYLREKLVQFSLTPEEWVEYQTMPTASSERLFQAFESFYKEADHRSQKIAEKVRRLSSDFPSSSDAPLVLVCGGFHTPAMVRLFKKWGMSVVVVQPRINKSEGEKGTEYLSLFTRDKTPIERLFAGRKINLAPAHVALGASSQESKAVGFKYLLLATAGTRILGKRVPKRRAHVKHYKDKDGHWAFVDSETDTSAHYVLEREDPAAFGKADQHIQTPFGRMAIWGKDHQNFSPQGLIERSLLVPLREIGFPLISAVLFPVNSPIPFWFLLVLAINGLVFAAFHENRDLNGNFNWNAFLGRAGGAIFILFGSHALAFDSGTFLMATVSLHGFWNLIVKEDWQLSMKGSKKAGKRKALKPGDWEWTKEKVEAQQTTEMQLLNKQLKKIKTEHRLSGRRDEMIKTAVKNYNKRMERLHGFITKGEENLARQIREGFYYLETQKGTFKGVNKKGKKQEWKFKLKVLVDEKEYQKRPKKQVEKEREENRLDLGLKDPLSIFRQAQRKGGLKGLKVMAGQFDLLPEKEKYQALSLIGRLLQELVDGVREKRDLKPIILVLKGFPKPLKDLASYYFLEAVKLKRSFERKQQKRPAKIPKKSKAPRKKVEDKKTAERKFSSWHWVGAVMVLILAIASFFPLLEMKKGMKEIPSITVPEDPGINQERGPPLLQERDRPFFPELERGPIPLNLPAPQPAFEVLEENELEEYGWVPQWAVRSAARWGELEIIMRKNAMAYAEKTGQPVEIPELARDRDGMLIRTIKHKNQTYLVFEDGKTQNLPQAMDPRSAQDPNLGHFDIKGRFFVPPQGMSFQYVAMDTDDPNRPYRQKVRDRTGQFQSVPLIDMSGRPLPPTGFRPLDPNRFTRHQLLWRGDDGQTSSVFRKDSHPIQVHPLSHFEVKLGSDKTRSQKAYAITLKNRTRLKNNLEVVRLQIESKDFVALLVDPDTYQYKGITSLNELPKDAKGKPSFQLWTVGVDGRREPFDPKAKSMSQPDEITVKDKQGKTRLVLFTLHGGEKLDPVDRDMDSARSKTIGMISTSIQPVVIMKIPPVFMLAKDRWVRDRRGRIQTLKIPIIRAYSTIEAAVKKMESDPRTRNKSIIGQLTGDFFLAAKSGYEWNTWKNGKKTTILTLANSDSPDFEQIFMELYDQAQWRGSYHGILMTKTLDRVVDGETIKDRGIVSEDKESVVMKVLKNHKEVKLKLTSSRFRKLKKEGILKWRGGFLVRMMDQGGMHYEFLSEREFRSITSDLKKGNKARWPGLNGSVVVRMGVKVGNQLRPAWQKLTDSEYKDLNKKLELSVQEGTLIKYCLAYKVKEGEVQESFDDPNDVRELLNQKDLLFRLNSGDLVHGWELNQNANVIGHYDPRDETELVVGSEWLRISLLMNEAVRTEKTNRVKKSRQPAPEILILTPGISDPVRGGKVIEEPVQGHTIGVDENFDPIPMALQELGINLPININKENAVQKPYHPAYEWGFGLYLEKKKIELKAAIQKGNLSDEDIQKRYEELKHIEKSRSFPAGNYRIVIKGTPLQQRLKSQEEWRNLRASRQYADLWRTGQGGEIVIRGGATLKNILIYQELAQEKISQLAKEWFQLDLNSKDLQKKLKTNKWSTKQKKEVRQRVKEIEEAKKSLNRKGLMTVQKAFKRISALKEKGTGNKTVQTIRYGQKENYSKSRKAQKSYIAGLNQLIHKKGTDELELERLTALRDQAIKENSYVDESGNVHIVVPPLKGAVEQRNVAFLRVQQGRETLEIKDKLMRGETVLFHWRTVRNAEGALEVRKEELQPDEFIPRMQESIQKEADPKRKQSRQNWLDNLLKNKVIEKIDDKGEGYKWILIDNEFKKGGFLHEIRSKNKEGTETRSLSLVPPQRVEPILNSFLSKAKTKLLGATKKNLKKQVQSLERQIKLAEESGVFIYTDGKGKEHRWSSVSTLSTAENQVREKKNDLEAAKKREKSLKTVVYETNENQTILISDPSEVKEVQRALSREKVELWKRYEDLLVKRRGNPDPVIRSELKKVVESFQQAEKGLFEKDGTSYVIKPGFVEARKEFNKQSRHWAFDHPSKRILSDSNGMKVGAVIRTGNTFALTKSRLVGFDEKTGFTWVENRVFVGRGANRGVRKTDLNHCTLVYTERIVLDDEQRIRFVISGRTSEGQFKPLFVTEHAYDDAELDLIDIASRSATYKYVEGLSVDLYKSQPVLENSVVLSTRRDIERTGRLIYERSSPSGKRWQEIKDRYGRVLTEIKGYVDSSGHFIPLVEIQNFYDNPNHADFNLLKIPYSSEVKAVGTGRRIGRSRLLTSFDDFMNGKTVAYEKWDDIDQTMVWEVKNQDGLLVRKYALKPIKNRVGRVVGYRPFNVTLFRYDEQDPDTLMLGLAKEAFTFQTDKKGRILGELKIDADGNIDGDYFESTRFVKTVTPDKNKQVRSPAYRGTQVVYRISVRSGKDKPFEQFQQVKNMDGLLLENYVGHNSGDKFVPEEITFHFYDFEKGNGRYGKIDGSKTYFLRFDEGLESTDFSSLRHHAALQGIDPETKARYEMILKESSVAKGINKKGSLFYDRELFVYTHDEKGQLKKRRKASIADRIEQGRLSVGMDKGRDRVFNLTYDDTKSVIGGEVHDHSQHASSLSAAPDSWKEGVSREVVWMADPTNDRGFRTNPHLPGLSQRYWRKFQVEFRNDQEQKTYTGQRWDDVSGRTAVEELRKKSDEGEDQTFLSLHINDRHSTGTSHLIGRDKLGAEFTIHLQGDSNTPSGPVDASHSHFLYFTVEPDRSLLPKGEFSVSIVIKDKGGREQSYRTKEKGDDKSDPNYYRDFWIPVEDNIHQPSPNESVNLVAESIFLDKKFVFAVPVSQLLDDGLDVGHLDPALQVTLNQINGEVGSLRVTDVYRAGIARDPPSLDSDQGQRVTQEARLLGGFFPFSNPTAEAAPLSQTNKKDKKESFHVISPKLGQSLFYDATLDRVDEEKEDEGFGIPIRGPDHRLLGVFRVYRYNHQVTGEPVEMRRLILYDKSGTYPIANVLPVWSDDGRLLGYDKSDVVPVQIAEEGLYIHVFSETPYTDPHYPENFSYRVNALHPGQPREGHIGFSHLPLMGEKNDTTQTITRVHNNFFNRIRNVVFKGLKGFPWKSGGAQVGEEEIRESFERLDSSLLKTVNDRLEKMNKDLPPHKMRSSPGPKEPVDFDSEKLSPSHWQGFIWWGLVLWPFWLLMGSIPSHFKWKKKRAEIKERNEREGDNRFTLVDKETIIKALDRFNDKVTETVIKGFSPAGDPILLTSDANIEGGFLNNLFLIYILVFSWHEKANFKDERRLVQLDYFAKALWRFLSEKVIQGSDPGVTRYDVKGKFDPLIGDKLELYLIHLREKLKTVYALDLASGDPGRLYLGGMFREFRALIRSNLKVGVKDHRRTAVFVEDRLNEYIKKERFAKVPAAFITLGRHLLKILPIFWGLIAFWGGDIFVQGSLQEGSSTIPEYLVPLLIVLSLLAFIINAWTERRAIRSARVTHLLFGRLRAVFPLVVAVGSFFILVQDQLHFPVFALILGLFLLMVVESIGILLPESAIIGGNRSLMGVSFYYHTRAPYHIGRGRAIVLMLAVNFVFVGFSLYLGATVLPWFMVKFAAEEKMKVALALVLLFLRLPLLHHGINLGLRILFSWLIPTFGARSPPDAEIDPDHHLGIVHVGGDSMASQLLTRGKSVNEMAGLFLKNFQTVYRKVPSGKESLGLILRKAADDPALTWFTSKDLPDEIKVEKAVLLMLLRLYDAESMADHGKGTTLWSLRQMSDPTMPDSLSVSSNSSDTEKAAIRYGWEIRRHLVGLLGTNAGDGYNSMDTAIHFVELAEAAAEKNMDSNLVFYNGFNQYNDHDDFGKNPLILDVSNRSEAGQRKKHALLIQHVAPEARAYVAYNHTVFGLKSAAMNEVLMAPVELPKLKSILISDRNSTMLNVRKFVDRDIKRMLTNPNLAIIVAQRTTTYVMDALGRTSMAIEGGHGQSLMSISDKIGTGWMNIMRNTFFEVLRESGDPLSPFRTFKKGEDPFTRDFGIIGFAPNAIGISEDNWAVLQQFHNLVGLGYTPELALSEALGHKPREQSDYAEWKNAPPRWSGGLVQTMESLLNQQASEFGPESIFEKEVRQTNSDHYLLGPLILLDLFMIPLSVLTDTSPFIGISLLFWIPGLVLNQISTMNSLMLDIRHMGFWPGLGRWVSDRVSDAMLFSSRTVRDALAQLAGYRGLTFEFKLSGGGGGDPWKVIFPYVIKGEVSTKDAGGKKEQDKWMIVLHEEVLGPKEFNQRVLIMDGIIPKIRNREIRDRKNIKKIKGGGVGGLAQHLRELYSFHNTFWVGIILIMVNFVAMINLDATNAVMMILSLWFSVGIAFGPMLKSARKGSMVWGGKGDLVAKVVGWLFGLGVLFAVAWLMDSLFLSDGQSAIPEFILAGAVTVYLWLGKKQTQWEKNKKLQGVRFLQEIRKGFWTMILLFGWFLIVPLHPVVRFDITPTIPKVVTPVDFGLYVLLLAVILLSIIFLGKLIGTIQMRKKTDGVIEDVIKAKDFVVQILGSIILTLLDGITFIFTLGQVRLFKTIRDTYLIYVFSSVARRVAELDQWHRGERGNDYALDAAYDGLMTQVETFVQGESYRMAHLALEDIERLFEERRWARRTASSRPLAGAVIRTVSILLILWGSLGLNSSAHAQEGTNPGKTPSSVVEASSDLIPIVRDVRGFGQLKKIQNKLHSQS